MSGTVAVRSGARGARAYVGRGARGAAHSLLQRRARGDLVTKPLVRTVLGIGSSLLLGGCFAYVPVDLAAVPEGEDLRVELTRVGFASMPPIPNNQGPDLTGVLVRGDADRLLLRVPVTRPSGMAGPTLAQEISIPVGEIVRIERREFNRVRTALAVLGGVAALAAVVAGFDESGSRAPEVPEKPQDPEAGVGFGGVTLLSIPAG